MNENLNKALKRIDEKYGKETVMKLEPKPQRNIGSISTGALTLDLATGIRGIPKSHITEIFGRAGSGKSTLAMHLLKNAQADGLTVYVDAEHTFDPKYAKRIGVDLDNVLVCQPENGEKAFNIIYDLIDLHVALVVIDSVSALIPLDDIKDDNINLGSHSRMMKAGLFELAVALEASQTAVVFINQLRDKASTFGRQVRTTGGAALKFYASLRIGLINDGYLEDGDDHFGIKLRARIVKNKFAAPYQEAELKILFNNKGISYPASVLDAGLKAGVIAQSGSWFKYKNGQPFQKLGWKACQEHLEENPTMVNDIESQLLYGGNIAIENK